MSTPCLPLQGMDKLAVNQGMEDLAVDELRQGMEVGRRPRQDAEDGGSCHQQELAVERMKVARAAGACPAGGGRGVNSLSLSQTLAVAKPLYHQWNRVWQAARFLPAPKLVSRQASRTCEIAVPHRPLMRPESPRRRFAPPRAPKLA
jgi:hypothetical protein